MEQLSFNRNGQWSLNKSNTLEKDSFDEKAVGETPTYANEKNQSFRTMDNQGSLKEDHGQKGSLHGNPPSKSPKHTSQNKAKGKVPTPTASRYADNNPGLKPTT